MPSFTITKDEKNCLELQRVGKPHQPLAREFDWLCFDGAQRCLSYKSSIAGRFFPQQKSIPFQEIAHLELLHGPLSGDPPALYPTLVVQYREDSATKELLIPLWIKDLDQSEEALDFLFRVARVAEKQGENLAYRAEESIFWPWVTRQQSSNGAAKYSLQPLKPQEGECFLVPSLEEKADYSAPTTERLPTPTVVIPPRPYGSWWLVVVLLIFGSAMRYVFLFVLLLLTTTKFISNLGLLSSLSFLPVMMFFWFISYVTLKSGDLPSHLKTKISEAKLKQLRDEKDFVHTLAQDQRTYIKNLQTINVFAYTMLWFIVVKAGLIAVTLEVKIWFPLSLGALLCVLLYLAIHLYENMKLRRLHPKDIPRELSQNKVNYPKLLGWGSLLFILIFGISRIEFVSLKLKELEHFNSDRIDFEIGSSSDFHHPTLGPTLVLNDSFFKYKSESRVSRLDMKNLDYVTNAYSMVSNANEAAFYYAAMKFRREKINVEFRFYEKLFLGTLLCELTCLPESDHTPNLLQAEWLQRELKLTPSKGFRVGLLSEEEVQQKLPAILRILTPEDADFVLGLLRERGVSYP